VVRDAKLGDALKQQKLNRKVRRAVNDNARRALRFKRQRWKEQGMDPDDATRVFLKNHACQICGDEPECLAIDHDHATGEVRGALCTRCNMGLGFFRDSVTNLETAIRYLKRTLRQGKSSP
jgi:hypothetical protein